MKAVAVLPVVVFVSAVAMAFAGSADPAPARGAKLLSFKSPSGNINCQLAQFSGSRPYADCVVRFDSWPRLPPKPRSCEWDWVAADIALVGQRVFLGDCRSDAGPLCPTVGTCFTLAYGRSLTLGGIRCTSARTGVTCRRLTGRRQGFRISREGYVLYR